MKWEHPAKTASTIESPTYIQPHIQVYSTYSRNYRYTYSSIQVYRYTNSRIQFEQNIHSPHSIIILLLLLPICCCCQEFHWQCHCKKNSHPIISFSCSSPCYCQQYHCCYFLSQCQGWIGDSRRQDHSRNSQQTSLTKYNATKLKRIDQPSLKLKKNRS